MPESWWEGLGSVVPKVLVTGGHEEIFRDHIFQFIDVLRRKKKNELGMHIALDEAHDGS